MTSRYARADDALLIVIASSCRLDRLVQANEGMLHLKSGRGEGESRGERGGRGGYQVGVHACSLQTSYPLLCGSPMCPMSVNILLNNFIIFLPLPMCIGSVSWRPGRPRLPGRVRRMGDEDEGQRARQREVSQSHGL